MGTMPLEEEQKGSPNKIATGAFARDATIMEIEDFSNYPGQSEVNRFDSGWEPELCLKLVINDGKRDDKKFMITGWFNKDKNTKIIKGWSNYKNAVHRFCMRIGGEFIKIDEDNFSIPPDVLQKFVGLKFMFVRYITPDTYTNNSGDEKPNYADWNMVFAEGTKFEEITKEFSENAGDLLTNKNPSYRYAPEKAQEYDAGDTSFPHGANVSDVESGDHPTKGDIPEEDVI